jgi:hypothetical protein
VLRLLEANSETVKGPRSSLLKVPVNRGNEKRKWEVDQVVVKRGLLMRASNGYRLKKSLLRR